MKKYGQDIWIVTIKGIQRYSFKTGKWDSYMIDKNITVLSDTGIYLSRGNKIGAIKKGTNSLPDGPFSREVPFLRENQLKDGLLQMNNWWNLILKS